MMDRNQRVTNSLKTQLKAKINHAKIILFFLAFYGVSNAFQLYNAIGNTLYPDEYLYWKISSSFTLTLPFIICLFFKKTGIIIGILLAVYLVLSQSLYLGSLIWTYVIVAQIVGYKAILESDRINKTSPLNDNILDSDLF